MENQPPWYEDASIPALMRAARGSYGGAVRETLAAAGFDDVPTNGAFILGGLANQHVPLGEIVSLLGASKQAASQLIDTLVLRGYLERQADPVDRRRLIVSLTDRGAGAAEAIARAVAAIDAELGERISAAELRGLRAGLGALATIREAAIAARESDDV